MENIENTRVEIYQATDKDKFVKFVVTMGFNPRKLEITQINNWNLKKIEGKFLYFFEIDGDALKRGNSHINSLKAKNYFYYFDDVNMGSIPEMPIFEWDIDGEKLKRFNGIPNRIESIHFKKLKGLENVDIKFEKPLTAIMGVNGAGKSTVIHAMSCIYQSLERQDIFFPHFFPPNPDAMWNGSDFSVSFECFYFSLKSYKDIKKKFWNLNGTYTKIKKNYLKKDDRWAPAYNTRPFREVYYIGISTCIPKIEQKTYYGRVYYNTKNREKKNSKQLSDYAAYILNMDYETLTESSSSSDKYIGVKRESLKNQYTSLSMGAGEQRTLAILDTVLDAENFSLILIDEIDLLMHELALKRLIKKLDEIARKKQLQIVFTTHSLVMKELTNIIGIQYLSKESGEYLVYKDITTEIENSVGGRKEKTFYLYVEDEFSKWLVSWIITNLGMTKSCDVKIFGSAENAFTLAASFIISGGQNLENICIILDGDVARTEEAKLDKMKDYLSGTEKGIKEKRAKAVSLLRQYNLPEGKSPEKYIHSLLKASEKRDNEIVSIAKGINAVEDKHNWLRDIRDELNLSEESFVRAVAQSLDGTSEWEEYIKPIQQWLQERKKSMK